MHFEGVRGVFGLSQCGARGVFLFGKLIPGGGCLTNFGFESLGEDRCAFHDDFGYACLVLLRCHRFVVRRPRFEALLCLPA